MSCILIRTGPSNVVEFRVNADTLEVLKVPRGGRQSTQMYCTKSDSPPSTPLRHFQ